MTNVMNGTVRYRPASGRRYIYPADVNPPELPWLVPDTDYRAPSGGKVGSGTLWTCLNATDLANAIANASPGDTISAPAGTLCTIRSQLPARDPSNPIHVYSSKLLDGSWVISPSVYHLNGTQTRGTRVTVAQGFAAQGALSPLAQFVLQVAGTGSVTILSTDVTGGGGWRFEGIEFMVDPASTGNVGCNLVALGLDDAGNQPTSIAGFPRTFHFGHCLFHGNFGVDLRRGVAVNAANIGFRDCYFYNIQQLDTESQAIAGWACPGPFAAINCFISAAAEGSLIGGGFTNVPNILQRNFTYKWCEYWKDNRWFASSRGDARYDVKNHLEHKMGTHILVEDCMFRHMAADAQNGTSLGFNSLPNGSPPWPAYRTTDITLRNIHMYGGGPIIAAGGCQFDNGPPASGHVTDWVEIPTSRILITNLLAAQICGALVESYPTGGSPTRWGMFFASSIRDVFVDHSTFEAAAQGIQMDADTVPYYDGTAVTRLTLRNNVIGHGAFGSVWGVAGANKASLDVVCQLGYSMNRNVLYDATNSGSAESNQLPNNGWESTVAPVGFDASYSTNNPSGLAGTSAYKGFASDGSDPGADVSGINAMVSAVQTPDYPPGATP